MSILFSPNNRVRLYVPPGAMPRQSGHGHDGSERTTQGIPENSEFKRVREDNHAGYETVQRCDGYGCYQFGYVIGDCRMRQWQHATDGKRIGQYCRCREEVAGIRRHSTTAEQRVQAVYQRGGAAKVRQLFGDVCRQSGGCRSNNFYRAERYLRFI